MARQGLLSACAVALLALVASQIAAADGAGERRLTDAESFAFAIGNGNLAGGPAKVANRLGPFDLVVVDGEEASAAEVAALRERGSTVLAYLSVGTVEAWRGWYRNAKRFRLRAWQDWKDEWFADVSKPGLRELLAGRVAPRLLRKGFDGLFLDNVDMIEPRRHRAQRKGMRRLVRRLASVTHRDAGLLFAQNGAWGLRRFGILPSLDGWNREDVSTTYDFDRKRYRRAGQADRRAALRELRRMRAEGLFTTSADYTARSSGALYDDAVASACEAGALPYVGDIGLTARRLPDPPITCP